VSRIDSARELVARQGLELLLVSPSADLRYLADYAAHASERPTLLAVSAEGPARILVPQLEAPRLPVFDGVDLVVYDETEDPYHRLTEALGDREPRSVALSDQTWAAVLLQLQTVWPGTQFMPASPILRELRMRKSMEEVEALERAGHLADEVFAGLRQVTLQGRSERDVSSILEGMLRERGLSDVWQIVASGRNSASPHHMSGDRIITSGDAVVLDFGGSLAGYQADITRTVYLGPPDDEFVRVYEVVRQAQDASVRAAVPGVSAEEIDTAARSVIEAAGYGSFFIHRTGHGIGMEVHEEPYIVEGNLLPLEPGMTFSIEPGIYLPRKFGVRIEDIVAVTDRGARRLNDAPRELQIL
jgi:Xaa-Pro aminopeptidase